MKISNDYVESADRIRRKSFIKSAACCCLLVIMVLTGNLLTTSISNAASAKRSKACKAYNSFLKKNVSRFDDFIIADLDSNGVPELITYHGIEQNEEEVYFFEYKNGKVVQCKDGSGNLKYVNVTCPADFGHYEIYKCKKNHIHIEWNAGMIGYSMRVYEKSKGRIIKHLEYQKKSDFCDKTFYKKNEKSVSKKKYRKALSACGNSGYEYFHDNTVSERKKYCK